MRLSWPQAIQMDVLFACYIHQMVRIHTPNVLTDVVQIIIVVHRITQKSIDQPMKLLKFPFHGNTAITLDK